MEDTLSDAGCTQIFNVLFLGCAPFHSKQVSDEVATEIRICTV